MGQRMVKPIAKAVNRRRSDELDYGGARRPPPPRAYDFSSEVLEYTNPEADRSIEALQQRQGQRHGPLKSEATFEDKVLQRAVAMVLEAIYEQDFLDCSYGFRPGRSTTRHWMRCMMRRHE